MIAQNPIQPHGNGVFWAVFGLLFNAMVWGLSWWPFRELHAAGVHPLWATALMYALAVATLLLVRPQVLRTAWQHPGLWLLAVASGLTNVAFNWAVTVGDVIRVVLLFYLMPAWSVLLAWRLLGERPGWGALVRLVLAFAGVALVLLPPDITWQRLTAQLSGADLLAVLGGLCFALTNVTLRRLHATPSDARMLAMFGGGTLMACATAWAGGLAGMVPGLPAPTVHWVALGLGLAVFFLMGNYALQYGAARLAASTTAVIMLSEVVFASVSSALLAQATLQPRTLAGGALIMLAALLASVPLPWSQQRPARPLPPSDHTPP